MSAASNIELAKQASELYRCDRSPGVCSSWIIVIEPGMRLQKAACGFGGGLLSLKWQFFAVVVDGLSVNCSEAPFALTHYGVRYVQCGKSQ